MPAAISPAKGAWISTAVIRASGSARASVQGRAAAARAEVEHVPAAVATRNGRQRGERRGFVARSALGQGGEHLVDGIVHGRRSPIL